MNELIVTMICIQLEIQLKIPDIVYNNPYLKIIIE